MYVIALLSARIRLGLRSLPRKSCDNSGMGDADPESFAKVRAALGGTRFLFDASVSKVLRFMLEDHRGADALITETQFRIQYGWHLSHHQYFLRVAPGVLSKLLELAGVVAVDGPLSTVIAPATLDFPGTPLRWSFSRRRIWIAATPTTITINVREAASCDETPDPLPASIERPITFVEIDGGCPHCGVRAESYRELSDGGLVCGPCGRSFTRTVELPTARVLR